MSSKSHPTLNLLLLALVSDNETKSVEGRCSLLGLAI